MDKEMMDDWQGEQDIACNTCPRCLLLTDLPDRTYGRRGIQEDVGACANTPQTPRLEVNLGLGAVDSMRQSPHGRHLTDVNILVFKHLYSK